MASWSNEELEKLRRLWDVGLSANQIGARLGRSKNAVIGRAHRLKLPARRNPIEEAKANKSWKLTPQRVYRPRKKSKTVKVAMREPQPVRRGRRPVPRHQVVDVEVRIDRSCQYFIGEPTDDDPRSAIDDTRKCGAPTMVGSSYCPKHHEICYIPGSAGTWFGGPSFRILA